MSTGETIKAARRAAGLTQAELARRLGVTPQTVSQYERGVINPKLETLKKFANALGVDAWTLIDAGDSTGPDLPAGTSDKERSEIEQMTKERVQVLTFVKLDKEREQKLLDQIVRDFQYLNDVGQEKAVERVHELTEIIRYQNDNAFNFDQFKAEHAAQNAAGDAPDGTDTKE